MTMNWIETDGVGLRYELTGSGAGTLVLIHEMGGTLEGWDLVLPLLQGSRAVLRYDTRGAGLSTKLRGTASLDAMADDVVALLDALGRNDPVTVAGGAVGGAIALHVAARHPGRVRAVAALGPATGIPEERRPAIHAHADRVEREGMIGVADDDLARSYPQSLRSDASRYRRFRARWLANDPGSYAAIYRMLSGLDMAAEIAALRLPTLFLAGTQDPLRPPALIEPLSRTVAGSRFEAIETGHFMATQTPERVAASLNGFLAATGG
ncbi:alpha/beta fold hydrolase [Methylobacterium terricola]|uniref:Alpha/beta fold hydrolase n=2 Tax=Methylobacterium terricola TaxID=2583531 RepID=A0A5C4L8T4_9HYPH|nr:alpha/beta fold hydrolase [Methylobacterium terricola]